MAAPLQPQKPMQPNAPKPPPKLGVGNEFDLARNRAKQQESANLQGQKDALARRAAMLGGGVSGAMMKQEALAHDASAKRLQDANEGIDTAQRQEERRVNEMQAQMDLQRYGIDTQRELQEAGLTGAYRGQSTLAKTTAADQKALAEAGLTGIYNGSSTLAKQGLDASTKQNDFENKVNVSTLLSTTVGNLKTQGFTPEQVSGIIHSLFSGMDLGALGINVGGLMGSAGSGYVGSLPPIILPEADHGTYGGGGGIGIQVS